MLRKLNCWAIRGNSEMARNLGAGTFLPPVFKETGKSLLPWLAFIALVSFTNAGTSRSANYSISSGSLNAGGRPSSSSTYSNVGFISVQKTDSPERPTASAGEGDSKVELMQTGFRLVTKATINAEKPLPPSKPQILSSIPHQNLEAGSPISLEVEATGTQPMTFQWYKGRTPLTGQTSHKLTIAHTDESHAGIYRVLVRNPLGYRWGNKVYVQILEPPVITKHPASQTVVYGHAIHLSVEASGSPKLRFQWFRNNQPIRRANRNVLRLKALPEFEGTYHVDVSNEMGSISSASAAIQVHRPPVMDRAPISQVAVPGQEVIFSVAASGKDQHGNAVTYQWYKGRKVLVGETSETLRFSSTGADDAGVYFVEVRNEIGTLRSRPFRLYLFYPPEIVQQPADVITTEGGKAYFFAKARGSRRLQFQWFKDGAAIRRANRNRLHLYPVERADAGVYHVVVKNKVGSVESEPVSLGLTEATTLVSEPSDWTAPFSRWTVLEDLLEEDANPDSDLDNDGLPNLLEYAFFGNPHASDPEILPTVRQVQGAEGTHYLVVSWREASEATGIRYTLQSSTDLRSWEDLNLSFYPVTRLEKGSHTEVSLFILPEESSVRFYRIVVSQE